MLRKRPLLHEMPDVNLLLIFGEGGGSWGGGGEQLTFHFQCNALLYFTLIVFMCKLLVKTCAPHSPHNFQNSPFVPLDEGYSLTGHGDGFTLSTPPPPLPPTAPSCLVTWTVWCLNGQFLGLYEMAALDLANQRGSFKGAWPNDKQQGLPGRWRHQIAFEVWMPETASKLEQKGWNPWLITWVDCIVNKRYTRHGDNCHSLRLKWRRQKQKGHKDKIKKQSLIYTKNKNNER